MKIQKQNNLKKIELIDLSKKTVFVLGAGASQPYGFPLGPQLKRQIIEFMQDITQFTITTKNKFDKPLVQKFVHRLRDTSHETIDRFLEKQTELREIGAYSIANVLLVCETKCKMFPPSNWYKHIFNILNFEGEKPDTDGIKFITLNYERSLEHFFNKAIENDCSDKLHSFTQNKLNHLKIIHAHGSLGQYSEKDFGSNDINETILKNAAESIKIISDRLEDTIEYKKAMKAINDAYNLVFIGFGYDPISLQRLTLNTDLTNKRILGTALNISDERKDYVLKYFKRNTISGDFEMSEQSVTAERFCQLYLPVGSQI